MTTEQMDWVDDHRQQPTLPGMEAIAGDKVVPAKKAKKKLSKKGKSLRDMAYETQTASNVIMRQDMERGLHKPQKLDSVLAEELGTCGDPEVAEEALLLIHEHGAGLQLSLQQWAIVQRLVEAGIISGRAGS